MDIFKQAGDALSQFGREAGKQAEIVGLQTKLGGLDTELDRVYVEAGKRAHELVKAQQIYDDEIKVILRRAKDLQHQMMEVRQEIHDLQSGSAPEPTAGPACTECGKVASGTETFCANCGAKLPAAED